MKPILKSGGESKRSVCAVYVFIPHAHICIYVQVNIKGTYLMTREFLKRNLGRTRLTVLNTSSLASMFTRPGHSSYQPGKSQIVCVSDLKILHM